MVVKFCNAKTYDDFINSSFFPSIFGMRCKNVNYYQKFIDPWVCSLKLLNPEEIRAYVPLHILRNYLFVRWENLNVLSAHQWIGQIGWTLFIFLLLSISSLGLSLDNLQCLALLMSLGSALEV